MPFANIRRLAATSRRLRRHAVSGCSAASSRDSLIWPQPGVNRPTSPPVVIAGSALRVGAAGASLMQWPRHSSLVSSAGSLPARRVASLLANRHHCFQHTTGPQSVASRRQRCQSEDLDLPALARKLERQPARRVLGGSDQDAGKRREQLRRHPVHGADGRGQGQSRCDGVGFHTEETELPDSGQQQCCLPVDNTPSRRISTDGGSAPAIRPRRKSAAVKNDQNQMIGNDQQSLSDVTNTTDDIFRDDDTPQNLCAQWRTLVYWRATVGITPSCWRHFVRRPARAVLSPGSGLALAPCGYKGGRS